MSLFKVKEISLLDLFLVILCFIIVGIVLTSLLPADFSVWIKQFLWVPIVLFVVLGIKPCYAFWIKK